MDHRPPAASSVFLDTESVFNFIRLLSFIVSVHILDLLMLCSVQQYKRALITLFGEFPSVGGTVHHVSAAAQNKHRSAQKLVYTEKNHSGERISDLCSGPSCLTQNSQLSLLH